VFELIITLEDEEHPFVGSVTVKLYVPDAFMVGLAVLPPDTIPGPVQLNIAEGVVEEPLNTTDVTEQVRSCADPAFELGVPVLAFTTTELFAVHPFDGSVTTRL
jgi:hypothetical protein